MLIKPVKYPVVLVPACCKLLDEHYFHAAGEKYLLALTEIAKVAPLIMPALSHDILLDSVLPMIDGILLTGAVSNVQADHYGEIHLPHSPKDLARDQLTLRLIRLAVEKGLPIFGICRGFQEINVALGGSLHQEVHHVANLDDHREFGASAAEQYGPRHDVKLVEDGFLSQLLKQTTITVNSLHGQGIKQLASRLTAQAYAPDGLIEAFSIDDHPSFGLGVQWHPEWQAQQNLSSIKLFEAFSHAVYTYRQEKSM